MSDGSLALPNSNIATTKKINSSVVPRPNMEGSDKQKGWVARPSANTCDLFILLAITGVSNDANGFGRGKTLFLLMQTVYFAQELQCSRKNDGKPLVAELPSAQCQHSTVVGSLATPARLVFLLLLLALSSPSGL